MGQLAASDVHTHGTSNLWGCCFIGQYHHILDFLQRKMFSAAPFVTMTLARAEQCASTKAPGLSRVCPLAPLVRSACCCCSLQGGAAVTCFRCKFLRRGGLAAL